MAVGKEIKNKIGSISNTQKITSAMEKVAASKMRRTQDRMERGRPYSRNIMRVIGHVANASSEYRHEFMEEREIKRVGYIVISTDKGLCGGLNINLFRHLIRELREWDEQEVEVDLCLIGNKAADFFRAVGGNVVAATSHLGEEPAIAGLIGSIKVMLDSYTEGNIDRIFLANNVFVNTMSQSPQVEQIVPLFPEQDENMRHHWDYIYEPEAQELLEGLLTRFIEAEVYQAVMENHACEQAAKMIAMKNATENAGDLIDELQLLYNNERQAAITQEIAEIVGGAAAV